jgi:hypothetical protein
MGPTKPHIQLVLGILSLGVNLMGREAEHLSPSSGEVKNVYTRRYTPFPLIYLHDVDRDKSAFNFLPSFLSFQCLSTALYFHEK